MGDCRLRFYRAGDKRFLFQKGGRLLGKRKAFPGGGYKGLQRRGGEAVYPVRGGVHRVGAAAAAGAEFAVCAAFGIRGDAGNDHRDGGLQYPH